MKKSRDQITTFIWLTDLDIKEADNHLKEIYIKDYP